nr:MAG TPA: hypothetical protein [Caudoviricetes sp.]
MNVLYLLPQCTFTLCVFDSRCTFQINLIWLGSGLSLKRMFPEFTWFIVCLLQQTLGWSQNLDLFPMF